LGGGGEYAKVTQGKGWGEAGGAHGRGGKVEGGATQEVQGGAGAGGQLGEACGCAPLSSAAAAAAAAGHLARQPLQAPGDQELGRQQALPPGRQLLGSCGVPSEPRTNAGAGEQIEDVCAGGGGVAAGAARNSWHACVRCHACAPPVAPLPACSARLRAAPALISRLCGGGGAEMVVRQQQQPSRGAVHRRPHGRGTWFCLAVVSCAMPSTTQTSIRN